jgi:hypothetical protein
MHHDQDPDQAIRHALQAIATRHRLDRQRFHTRVTARIVYLYGELHHVGPQGAVSASLAQALELAVRTIPGVRGVSIDFRNWRRDEHGAWHPVLAQTIRAEPEAPMSAPAPAPEESDAPEWSQPYLHSERGLALRSWKSRDASAERRAC